MLAYGDDSEAPWRPGPSCGPARLVRSQAQRSSSAPGGRASLSGGPGDRRWQDRVGWANPLPLLDRLLPVVLPTGLPYAIWSTVVLLAITAAAVTVPLQVGFRGWRRLPGVLAADWATAAVFAADVVVSFRTAYITTHGELERNTRRIARRYLRGAFVLDVLAALPLTALLRAAGAGRGATGSQLPWLGLLKLARLATIGRLLRSRARGRHGTLLSMGRLLLALCCVVHAYACLWHYLAEQIPEWPWTLDACRSCSLAAQYLFAFYHCFLMLLGDRPDATQNAERVLALAMLYTGAFLYAVVMGNMALLVSNLWATASRHKQRAVAAEDALRYSGVGRRERDRVADYYSHMAAFEHPGPDGVAYLAELPPGLHAATMAALFGARLRAVPLLAGCERPFLDRLAGRLRLSLVMGGDTVYDIGAVGHDMYIVCKGAVALVDQRGSLAALVGAGEHFGERGLTAAAAPRTHRAVALRPCDVVLLSRWDLQDAMKDFPESAALVKYRARLRTEELERGCGPLWAAATGLADLYGDDLYDGQPGTAEYDREYGDDLVGLDEWEQQPRAGAAGLEAGRKGGREFGGRAEEGDGQKEGGWPDSEQDKGAIAVVEPNRELFPLRPPSGSKGRNGRLELTAADDAGREGREGSGRTVLVRGSSSSSSIDSSSPSSAVPSRTPSSGPLRHPSVSQGSTPLPPPAAARRPAPAAEGTASAPRRRVSRQDSSSLGPAGRLGSTGEGSDAGLGLQGPAAHAGGVSRQSSDALGGVVDLPGLAALAGPGDAAAGESKCSEYAAASVASALADHGSGGRLAGPGPVAEALQPHSRSSSGSSSRGPRDSGGGGCAGEGGRGESAAEARGIQGRAESEVPAAGAVSRSVGPTSLAQARAAAGQGGREEGAGLGGGGGVLASLRSLLTRAAHPAHPHHAAHATSAAAADAAGPCDAQHQPLTSPETSRSKELPAAPAPAPAAPLGSTVTMGLTRRPLGLQARRSHAAPTAAVAAVVPPHAGATALAAQPLPLPHQHDPAPGAHHPTYANMQTAPQRRASQTGLVGHAAAPTAAHASGVDLQPADPRSHVVSTWLEALMREHPLAPAPYPVRGAAGAGEAPRRSVQAYAPAATGGDGGSAPFHPLQHLQPVASDVASGDTNTMTPPQPPLVAGGLAAAPVGLPLVSHGSGSGKSRSQHADPAATQGRASGSGLVPSLLAASQTSIRNRSHSRWPVPRGRSITSLNIAAAAAPSPTSAPAPAPQAHRSSLALILADEIDTPAWLTSTGCGGGGDGMARGGGRLLAAGQAEPARLLRTSATGFTSRASSRTGLKQQSLSPHASLPLRPLPNGMAHTVAASRRNTVKGFATMGPSGAAAAGGGQAGSSLRRRRPVRRVTSTASLLSSAPGWAPAVTRSDGGATSVHATSMGFVTGVAGGPGGGGGGGGLLPAGLMATYGGLFSEDEAGREWSDGWSDDSGGRRAARQREAALRRQLAEAQGRLAAVLVDPLQVPAVAAAVQAEVARVAARLAAAFDQTLRRLAEGMAAAGAQADDLGAAVGAVDERLARLEVAAEGAGGAASVLGLQLGGDGRRPVAAAGPGGGGGGSSSYGDVGLLLGRRGGVMAARRQSSSGNRAYLVGGHAGGGSIVGGPSGGSMTMARARRGGGGGKRASTSGALAPVQGILKIVQQQAQGAGSGVWGGYAGDGFAAGGAGGPGSGAVAARRRRASALEQGDAGEGSVHGGGGDRSVRGGGLGLNSSSGTAAGAAEADVRQRRSLDSAPRRVSRAGEAGAGGSAASSGAAVQPRRWATVNLDDLPQAGGPAAAMPTAQQQQQQAGTQATLDRVGAAAAASGPLLYWPTSGRAALGLCTPGTGAPSRPLSGAVQGRPRSPASAPRGPALVQGAHGGSGSTSGGDASPGMVPLLTRSDPTMAGRGSAAERGADSGTASTPVELLGLGDTGRSPRGWIPGIGVGPRRLGPAPMGLRLGSAGDDRGDVLAGLLGEPSGWAGLGAGGWAQGSWAAESAAGGSGARDASAGSGGRSGGQLLLDQD